MRLSIDVGYEPNTVATVSDFMRTLETIIATNTEYNIVNMGCRDDNGNKVISLILVPKENKPETKEESTESVNNEEVIEVGEDTEVTE